MDGIQAFKANPLPGIPSRSATTLSLPTHNLASIKTPSHYFKALKRRVWLVLAIAVPLAIGTSIVVLRLPPVYLAKAELEINPPEIDQVLRARHPRRRPPRSVERRQLRTQPRIRAQEPGALETVLRDPAIWADANQYADPVVELFRTLSVQRLKQTNWFTISLEGKDPAKVKKLLETLLYAFQKQAVTETTEKLYKTEDHAKQNLAALKLCSGIARQKHSDRASRRTVRSAPAGGTSWKMNT